MKPRNFARVVAVLAVLAMPFAANAASEPIEPAKAKQYIAEVGNEVVALLGGSGLSPEGRNERFCRLMLKNIDFRELGKRVLGRMLRKSTPDQREEFYRLFAAHFINTLNKMIQGLEVTGFSTGRSRTYPNNEVVVATVIDKADGPKFEAGWRLASKGGTLKVVDIYVQGASAAGHFRDRMASSTQTSISGNITKLKGELAGSQTLQVVQAHMN